MGANRDKRAATAIFEFERLLKFQEVLLPLNVCKSTVRMCMLFSIARASLYSLPPRARAFAYKILSFVPTRAACVCIVTHGNPATTVVPACAPVHCAVCVGRRVLRPPPHPRPPRSTRGPPILRYCCYPRAECRPSPPRRLPLFSCSPPLPRLVGGAPPPRGTLPRVICVTRLSPSQTAEMASFSLSTKSLQKVIILGALRGLGVVAKAKAAAVVVAAAVVGGGEWWLQASPHIHSLSTHTHNRQLGRGQNVADGAVRCV